MEIKSKSSMAKHPFDKGFTLIEMLVVLFVISMLLVLFPVIKPQKMIQLQYEANAIKEILLTTQTYARITHQKQQVQVTNHQIQYLHHQYQLPNGIYCTPRTIDYAANGNINQAGTILCKCDGATKQIIYELGSGAVYVK